MNSWEKTKYGRQKGKDLLLEHNTPISSPNWEIGIKFYRSTSSQTKEPTPNNEMKFQTSNELNTERNEREKKRNINNILYSYHSLLDSSALQASSFAGRYLRSTDVCMKANFVEKENVYVNHIFFVCMRTTKETKIMCTCFFPQLYLSAIFKRKMELWAKFNDTDWCDTDNFLNTRECI